MQKQYWKCFELINLRRMRIMGNILLVTFINFLTSVICDEFVSNSFLKVSLTTLKHVQVFN